jgi:hypothetical protein
MLLRESVHRLKQEIYFLFFTQFEFHKEHYKASRRGNITKAQSMFDVHFLIKNLHLVPPIVISLGSSVNIRLTEHLGTIFSRPVRCMLDNAYRCGGNIVVGIDDLKGVSIGLVIVKLLPTIANMSYCILVVYSPLDGLH